MNCLIQSLPVPLQNEITMERKSTRTTIPFVKNNEFDYSWLVAFIKEDHRQLMDMAGLCPDYQFSFLPLYQTEPILLTDLTDWPPEHRQ